MKRIILTFFIFLPALLSANEFGNALLHIVANRIAKNSPEAGQILRAVAQPQPRVYVAPNTTIEIGQEDYSAPASHNQIYPEPRTARDYIVYGKLLGNAGKIEEAAQYFFVARNMEPDNPEARYGLALSLALLGQKERAQEEYEMLQRLTERFIKQTNKISRLLKGDY